MAVVLEKADIGRWLNDQAGTELLKPAAEDQLSMWPVSRRLNKTGTANDDPTLFDEWRPVMVAANANRRHPLP
jgi:putative SOS response-associated peptidase YedK